MKILVISHILPYPPHGGGLQRTFNLLKKMSEEHEVHLVSFTQRTILPTSKDIKEAKDKLSNIFSSVEVVDIPSDRTKILWYLLLLVNCISRLPYSVWRFRSSKFQKLVKKTINEQKFDVVHFDTIALSQYLDDIGNLPAVLNHHNAESQLLKRRGLNHPNILAGFYMRYQAWKLARYEKQVMPKFKAHLVVSDKDRETFIDNISSENIFVVPNGTDTEYYCPGDGQVKKELVFVGGMTWFPNKDAMSYFCSEIWPLIKRLQPNVILNIIGRAPSSEIIEYARKDSRILTHGFVEDMRTITRESAVFIVPIRVGGGTRLKIVDAMALGKAIVSTSIGAEGICYQEGHDILLADTPSEFAEKVINLLRDDELRIKLEKNARVTAKTKYSWDVIAPIQTQAYRYAIDSLVGV